MSKLHGWHREYNTEFLQLDSFEAANGKTLVYSHNEDDVIFLTFSDKTYIHVVLDIQDEDTGELDLYRPPTADEALKMGLIDQAEYDRANEAYRVKSYESILKYKRAQLAKLQAEIAESE